MADNMHGKPKKSLGQNYLVTASVAGKIVEAIDPGPEELVFEIGPGKGALTSRLSESGADLVAFEIDRALADDLKGVFRDDKVEVVNEDVLKVDFEAEALRRKKGKYKVIGNIPYMLTSSILIRIPAWKGCTLAVIMVQKEVAERVAAPAGDSNCGLLAVFLQSYLNVEKVLKVAAGSFYPRPGVDSAVLRFTRDRKERAPENRELYFAFLKKAFSKRRKKLRNVLFRKKDSDRRERAERLEDLSGIDLGKRAEELSLDEWFCLFSSYLEIG
ncbi:MAG TPA: 16S rRNA (adenine(1518)-N(6)/adenine(1519)-N(6))-dimethyltransferase RsmA [Candidatus Krumholzibacteriaceae bacterium]|nr:16S rRNA (adenine(1518)-N(6)/adenine(1519)-N(6))-dimethyltransferase RsmA [Candidatus Krumholzibacteriaceae bacterium]